MILSRVKISPQQRYDLEDFLAIQAASRADSKLWTQKFLSSDNLVLGGFTVSGVGLNSATVAMANAALIIPQNDYDFSYFISSPTESDVTISDADLVDGVRNYLEVELVTEDGVPLVKAFWDPEANSGNGAEFNQIVNTITDLRTNFVVSTGGFSGSPNRVPIAIIDTDGSGVIKVILDRREIFGRLAQPNDLDNEYNWGTKQEPVYQLNLTSVTGTFTDGEEISIGSETATVVTGGTTSITFAEPTGINFGNGDSVTGSDSGATGTVNTVFENFLGVDKSLNTQKSINDALMTEIKLMKGTRFWWQTVPSLTGIKNENMSVVVAISSGARISWTGSSVLITDDVNTPSDSDVVAAIRILSSDANLELTRQDDGREAVVITLDEIPDTGILTLDQDGNSIVINYNDSESTIQTTWDGAASEPATISGSLQNKKLTITFDSAGDQVDVFVDTNTLEKDSVAVNETLTIKQGMPADGSIAIGDGQVLYVDLPSTLADTAFSGLGIGASNFKVADRGSVDIADATYWLAYREGSKLYFKGLGELEAGETKQVDDETPQSLATFLGFDPEVATSVPYSFFPNSIYFENIFNNTSSLVEAISANTGNINALGDILAENVYSEIMTVVSGSPADDNEIQGAVTVGTLIVIPEDSRDADVQEEYVVGAGTLKVFLNGQLLYEGEDYLEVGSLGNLSDTIDIQQQLEIGDRLLFRIDTRGGFSTGSGGGGGDIDNASNVGGANEVFRDKVVDTLRFRTIESGNSIEVVQNSNTLAINLKLGTVTVNADHTAQLSDDLILVDASGGPVSIFLPEASTADGKRFYVKKIDATANAMIVDGFLSEEIDGLTTQQSTVQYESFTIICDGTAWYIV